MNRIIQEDIGTILAADLPWDRFSGATVLVSGANGFLPAYMVQALLELNRTGRLENPCQVLGVVRDMEKAKARFSSYEHDPNLRLIVHDISLPIIPSPVVDYIIHAASQASPVYFRTDPIGTLSANIIGTYNLLNMDVFSREKCKGFLYFSSGEVYGQLNSSTPITESSTGGWLDPLDVRSCYGESKRMSETMCVAWHSQRDIPTYIVRPFHTYGPGMRIDDGRVFADFVRDILNDGPITLYSDGSARRSFCYLADATIGFFTALLKGKPGQAYNVANPEGETSIAELADRLGREFSIPVTQNQLPTGSHQTVYMPSPIVSTFPSITKMNTLGWNPTTSIENGFRRTVESYR